MHQQRISQTKIVWRSETKKCQLVTNQDVQERINNLICNVLIKNNLSVLVFIHIYQRLCLKVLEARTLKLNLVFSNTYTDCYLFSQSSDSSPVSLPFVCRNRKVYHFMILLALAKHQCFLTQKFLQTASTIKLFIPVFYTYKGYGFIAKGQSKFIDVNPRFQVKQHDWRLHNKTV